MSDALYRYECVIAPHLLVPPALQDLITLRSANVYVRNSQDPDLLKKMRNSYQSAPIFDSEPKLPEYLEELYESIPGENMYEKFTECINCNCCERHQIDKPVCIYIPCHSKTIKIDQNEYYCKCNCRQASRFFNRLYSKQPKMREPVIVEDEM